MLQPQAKLSQLNLVQPLGSWIAPSTMKWKYSTWDANLYIQNVTHNISLGQRCVAIHFPHQPSLANRLNIQMYDTRTPDWFAAQVPKQGYCPLISRVATSLQSMVLQLNGQSFHYDYPPLPSSNGGNNFPQLKKRLLAFTTNLKVDSETQIRQHLVTLAATLYIGTDGGRKEGEGLLLLMAYLLQQP
jgi:hypothetical protein